MESNVRALASNLGRFFRPSEAYFVPMKHPRVALRVSWVRKSLPRLRSRTLCTVSASFSVQHVRCFSMVFLICAYVHFRLFLEFRDLKIANLKIRDGGPVCVESPGFTYVSPKGGLLFFELEIISSGDIGWVDLRGVKLKHGIRLGF